MSFEKSLTRRRFMLLAGSTGAGALAACSKYRESRANSDTVIEVLAREHGVLYRSIAILEELRGGMDARMDLPPEIIGGTVEMVRLFMVAHHQQVEEKYIYPLFASASKLSGLIGVLREQHAASSRMTEILKGLSTGFSAKDLERRRTMESTIHQFCRMYRAHANWEDTMLFPVLRSMMPEKAYTELSTAVSKAQTEFLGRDGFSETILKLNGYENILGIGDIASFTPHLDELN